MILSYFFGLAALIWLITLLLPWRAWQINEVLEADAKLLEVTDLSDITVVIPARNEAEVIGTTLAALVQQGANLNVIVVDDDSSDATATIARSAKLANLEIIAAKRLPEGWSGKLWAQQQGLERVKTDWTLLLDADIALLPGMIASLKRKQQTENLDFVSLMAMLRFNCFWEKLLLPAFIYFFKMLYPFALANNPKTKLAAAAGGCILVKTSALEKIGTLASIKDALIDDCTLAKRIKSAGYRIWVGLTHGVISQRPYSDLNEIWQMVARTAYTQLSYSPVLLIACTAVMLLMYVLPVFGLFYAHGLALYCSIAAILIMVAIYYPTLRFYAMPPFWGLTMPLVASMYLLMTWSSAWHYWQGERSRWKGRIYKNPA